MHCDGSNGCGELKWKAMGPIPFDVFAQGEYVGPARLPHLPEYRLRVDDVIEFVFRLTQDASATPYRLEVGDTVRIESLTAPELNRDVSVEPDGNITVMQIGQIPAANRTVPPLFESIRIAWDANEVARYPTRR